MRVIIAGSRHGRFTYKDVDNAIKDSGFEITEVFCGEAKGPDSLGKEWAFNNGIKCKSFKPNWNKYPKTAGMIRNADMLVNADALIVLIYDNSPGSMHMHSIAKTKGIPVFVVRKEKAKPILPSYTIEFE